MYVLVIITLALNPAMLSISGYSTVEKCTADATLIINTYRQSAPGQAFTAVCVKPS